MQGQLSTVHKQLQHCVLQIESLAAHQERNRIAQDLHDSLGYALTALNIQLQTADRLLQLNPEQARTFLVKAQQLGSVAVQEVRQAVGNLRADNFEGKTLELLIRSLVEDFNEVSGIQPEINFNLSVNMSHSIVTTLYRVIQESLTNISKHAAATMVAIDLEATAEQVRLTIIDNGKGFHLAQDSSGFGLHSMRSRVTALMGRFEIQSEVGAGCQIRVELPLEKVSYSFQTKPRSGSDSFTPASLAMTHPGVAIYPVLSPQQYAKLEAVLVELIGPIAPVLLEQAVSQVHCSTELIEQLMVQLPTAQRARFQQTVATWLQDPIAAPQPDPQKPSGESKPLLSSEFISHCKQTLAEFVGPIAIFLVQNALSGSSRLSPKQLIERLANTISNPQDASAFKYRLLDSI